MSKKYLSLFLSYITFTIVRVGTLYIVHLPLYIYHTVRVMKIIIFNLVYISCLQNNTW